MNTFSSRTLFWTAINLILIALTVIIWKILIFGLPILPQLQTITVNAEGKAVVTPDIATISFSVISEGKDPGVIQEENIKKMNAAIAFVKDKGVGEKDIKTTGYDLYPRYDYSRPRPVGQNTPFILGYTLTQTVTIKVRDLEKISPILGGLPGTGINQITSVGFDIDDPEIYLSEAREEAFKKAFDKAQIMARQNGTSIKRVVTFSESGGGYPGPYYFAESRALGFGGDTASAPPAPSIETGTQDVTVFVTVIYEIR
jgi:uncharacterized protein